MAAPGDTPPPERPYLLSPLNRVFKCWRPFFLLILPLPAYFWFVWGVCVLQDTCTYYFLFLVRISCDQAGLPLCVSAVYLGLLTLLPPLLDTGLTAAHIWLPHSLLKCLLESIVLSYSFLCACLLGYNFPAALTFLLLVLTFGIFFFQKKCYDSLNHLNLIF